MNHKLQDLIDIPILQDLQNKLNVIYSFPSAIIDNDGNVLTAVAWQDVCTKFHRTNPLCEKECIKSDLYILEHLHEAKPAVSYQCPHGLVDNATPIIIDGQHMGNFFTGQFFLEKPDLAFFKKQAKKYGFNEKEYLEAVEKVPIWTLEKLAQYLDFIKGFIEIIAGLGLKNLQEIETNKILKEIEERNQAIIQSTSDLVWEINEHGKYCYCSERVEQIIGYTVNEIIGKSPLDFVVPEDRISMQEFMNNLKETKSPIIDFENWYIHKNGHNVCLLTNGFPIFDNTGKLIGYRGADKDITDRKHAEKELIKAKEKAEESELKYKLLYNNTPVMLHSSDMGGNIVAVNDYWLQILGYEKHEVIGTKSSNYLTFQSKQLYYHTLKEFIQIGELNNLEIQAVKKNGEIVDLLVSSKILYNNEGKPTQSMTNLVNITERKNSERDLFESRVMQKAIMDSTTDLIWSVDSKKFGLLSFNQSLTNHFLKEQGIQIKPGDRPEDLFPPGEFVKIWHKMFNKALQEGEYIIEYSTFSGGHLLELSFNLLVQNNNIFGISVFGKDISERKRAENELIIAKEHAVESDRLKTAFLQNMSHEIRTPMNAIMGFSELLVKNYNNKPKLEKFSEIINQRCNDLLDIISDILDIAKIESGQLTINFEECNLNKLFAELTYFFSEHQKRIGKQQINFKLLTSHLVEKTIVTDKVKLKQILINLIGNAFKFTDNGKIEGGYKTDANNNIIFYISDTGIGIPSDKQNIIFERFTQLKQNKNHIYGGTGLGLSIVKGLVNLLGGKIWLESEPGKGTTFYFSTPYKTSQIIQQEPLVLSEPNEFHFQNKTILIVEDDEFNTEYIKEILADTGLHLICALFGKEAIEIAITQVPDIILMDIRLPDMNGFEVTQQIKQHNPSIKIIAQTAYAAHEDKQKAFDAGCNDYLSKPLKQDLLLSMINKHLKA